MKLVKPSNPDYPPVYNIPCSCGAITEFSKVELEAYHKSVSDPREPNFTGYYVLPCLGCGKNHTVYDPSKYKKGTG